MANIGENEVDGDTKKKLRGDAIGDTMYSEKFVLETLLKLRNVVWEKDLEEDLCSLWDMTLEKDICKYLLDFNFVEIACNLVDTSKENRLIEILIGILTNILLVKKDTKLKVEEVQTVLQELDNPDPLTLLQIFQFIIALSHLEENNCLGLINEIVLSKIYFILNNSMNCELLLKALEAMVKLTDSKLNQSSINEALFEACSVAYLTLMGYEKEEEFDMESSIKSKSVRFFLEIVNNICCYLTNSLLVIPNERYSKLVSSEIGKLLNHLTEEENLIPLNALNEFFLSSAAFIHKTLRLSYSTKVFLSVCSILKLIIALNLQSEEESYEACLELFCYLLSKVESNEVLLKDLKSFEDDLIIKQLVEAAEAQFKNYDFECSKQIDFVKSLFK